MIEKAQHYLLKMKHTKQPIISLLLTELINKINYCYQKISHIILKKIDHYTDKNELE